MDCPLTVFTPTYNRAYCLQRAYDSLCRQTCKDFEWLVVDDGSSDGTQELVNKWKSEAPFPIHYLYKNNGGMHTAHNAAHAHITTELSICLDSDDMLADDCIESVLDFWAANQDIHEQVGGIIAEDGHFDGSIIGTHLPDVRIESEDHMREVMGVCGDKKIIYRSCIASQVPPYPEFSDEKFGSMAFKRRMIEVQLGLKWLVMRRIIYLVEYMGDGASHNMYTLYRRAYKGWEIERIHGMLYSRTFKRRYISAIHYVSNSIFLKKKNLYRHNPCKFLTSLAIIPGLMLNLYIRLKTRHL